MNLRDLEYLVKLAELQHFGKAAKACFVSQPTLSMQLKKLEEELGVQLFERTNKRVLLTSIGKAITEQAKRVLDEASQLKRLAKSAHDPDASELRVGIIPTIAPYLLPKIMPAINQALPKLKLILYEAQTAVLLQKLQAGEIDTAILALPINSENLTSQISFTEPFYLAVPRLHLLAREETVNYASLKEQSLLLLEDGHCLRGQALEICQLSGAKELLNFRATSLETLRHLVSAGIGITLMPAMAVKQDDNITYLSFAEPKPQRQIGMVWRPTSIYSSIIMQLLNLTKRAIH